jgi:hypothetical protein
MQRKGFTRLHRLVRIETRVRYAWRHEAADSPGFTAWCGLKLATQEAAAKPMTIHQASPPGAD